MAKTAFVLSGGGAKGCFQIGVLKQLHANGVRPDVVYGTSVGALNITGWAYIGIEELEKIWLGIRGNSDIIRFQVGTMLFSTRGIYSTSPLRKLVETIIAGHQPSKSFPVVCMTNIASGSVVYVNPYNAHEFDMTYSDAVIASASMPLFMEPVNKHWVDGGVREVSPLRQAIHDDCNEIYVVLTEPYVRNPESTDRMGSWITYGARALTLVFHEVFLNDLLVCQHYNEHNNKKIIRLHIYAPDRVLIDTLEFDPEKIRAGIRQGEAAVEIENPLDI